MHLTNEKMHVIIKLSLYHYSIGLKLVIVDTFSDVWQIQRRKQVKHARLF